MEDCTQNLQTDVAVAALVPCTQCALRRSRPDGTTATSGRGDRMQIKPVGEVLVSEGLRAPELKALVADETNYRVLLMQPHGQIEVSAEGVQNRDRAFALRCFGRFLVDARQTRVDLVITPEYSTPWETLVTAIREGTVPEQGKLWVLGCEKHQV